jgi:ubiquinone/menaquinone biosynthesis C-methylase UbiE
MVWEEEISEFVKSKIKGKSLNVPCGSSEIGDVRIDIDPNSKATEVGDMNKINYPDNSFDTVISDPIWKLNYYKRPRQFFELVRVCKVGGLIIFNATWIPTSKAVELKETYIRRSAQFGNVSVISVFEKVRNYPPLEEVEKEVKKDREDDPNRP